MDTFELVFNILHRIVKIVVSDKWNAYSFFTILWNWFNLTSIVNFKIVYYKYHIDKIFSSTK